MESQGAGGPMRGGGAARHDGEIPDAIHLVAGEGVPVVELAAKDGIRNLNECLAVPFVGMGSVVVTAAEQTHGRQNTHGQPPRYPPCRERRPGERN